MADGIWINEHKYLSFAEAANTSKLKNEIASRSAAWDFADIVGLLPDPDPVLEKMGEGPEILKSLMADGHLRSIVQTRKLGVLRKKFTFEPGILEGDKKPTSQAEQLCQDLNRDFNDLKPRNLLSQILDAPLYGFTPIELTFEPGAHLMLKKAEAKPNRWFGFGSDNEMRFKSQKEEEEGEKLPYGKFVVAQHFPTYDNPYGDRLLSACFWPKTLKNGGLKFWTALMEKYGMPFLVGHYGKGTTPDEQQQMLTKLERMIRHAVAVVPASDKIEMLGGSGKTGGGYMIFDKMRMACDAEMSKVILGQTLTSDAGDKGTHALGKVHEGVLSLYQESDQNLAKTTLDEIAVIYTRVNRDGVAPPVCTFPEQEKTLTEFADRDKALEQSGRFKLKSSYYIRRYGFQEDDFELVDKAAQPADHGEHEEKSDPWSVENQLALAAHQQDRLEEKIKEYVLETADIFALYKKQLRQWAKGHKSIKKALVAVPQLFDTFETDELKSCILPSLIDSDRLGGGSVPDETHDFAQAQWGKGRPFKEALEFFNAKAFTISNIARDDVVAGVKDELKKVLAHGGDIKTFRQNIDSLFIEKGLDPLASHHINTIYRTNMQSAYMAGRYQLLTKPHILKARPYWKYVAVGDGLTRPTHAAMNGKIFHHSNAIWQVWYPPNGFNCRCDVVSLSTREIERDGLTVTAEDLSGTAVEDVNKVTGEIKVYALNPDEGFGAKGGSLEKAYHAQRKKNKGNIRWRESDGQPGPADLGRPLKGAIPQEQWRPVKRGERLEDIVAAGKLSEGEAFGRLEALYRKEMGISPLETHSVVRAKDGEAIQITMEALGHAMVKRDDARERFIPYLRHTLEDPYEVLLTEYQTESGKTKYRKKYIALFKDEKQTGMIIVAEVQKDGAVLWNIMNTKKGNLDRQRKGVKLVYGR